MASEYPRRPDSGRASIQFDGSERATEPQEAEPPELLSTTVEYADRPNRHTIYPPGLSGIERMEQWITADTHDFVALEFWR